MIIFTQSSGHKISHDGKYLILTILEDSKHSMYFIDLENNNELLPEKMYLTKINTNNNYHVSNFTLRYFFGHFFLNFLN